MKHRLDLFKVILDSCEQKIGERKRDLMNLKKVFLFSYISILLFKGSAHEIEVILGPTLIRNFFILSESAPKIEISIKLECLIFAL